MRFLQIHGLEDLDVLPRGTWGIREPEDKYNGVARRDGECFFLLLGFRLWLTLTALDPDSENLDMILVPGWSLPTPWGRFSF